MIDKNVKNLKEKCFGFPDDRIATAARASHVRRKAILIESTLVKVYQVYTWLRSSAVVLLAFHAVAPGSRPPLVIIFFSSFF